jgi:hypothetical protein
MDITFGASIKNIWIMQNIPHCLNSSKISYQNRRSRCKIDTSSKHVLDTSLSGFGAGTPIKCEGVKLAWWGQAFPSEEMYWNVMKLLN